jgi:hypothetical protein
VINSVGVSNPDIGWSHPGVLVTSPGLLSTSTGNRVYNNDSYNNSGGLSEIAGNVRSSQLSLTRNATADPRLVDPANHMYTVTRASPSKPHGKRQR